MTKAELQDAMKLMQSRRSEPFDHDALDLLNGCALPGFKPVTCTRYHVAELIRWQCLQFDGEVDGEALNEIAEAGRRKFIVVD